MDGADFPTRWNQGVLWHDGPMRGKLVIDEISPNSMEALSNAYLLGAPALHGGQQAKHSAVLFSHSEQQQPPLLLPYSHRFNALVQVGHAFVVEVPPPPPPPTPTPSGIQSPNLSDFILVSLGLAVLFWIGNYVVPDFIFKKLFGPDMGNRNDSDKQKVLDGLVGGIDKTSSQVASGSEALAHSEEKTVRDAGFGKRASKVRKQNK